jgi:acetyltransferase
MLRHRLAAVFEPRSLLVLADSPLPVSTSLPDSFKDAVTTVDVRDDTPISIPAQLNGVEPGGRLDLALLCLSSSRLPQALDMLRGHRPRAVVLLTPVTPSSDPAQDMELCRAWALENGSFMLGPRGFGVQRPHLGLNLSRAPALARDGHVALVSQSGSIVMAVLDWAADINLGFSAVVSTGDEVGVGVADVLEYLATDPDTDSIVLYLENVHSARTLASALRAAAGVKPVVVLKSGRAAGGPGTSRDVVFNALMRRVGAVRVPYFVQLFSAIKVLRYPYRPKGRRIAVVSNGSGTARLALDVMGTHAAVFRAEFSMLTVRELTRLLERDAMVRNPVITHVRLDHEKMRKIIGILAVDRGVDGVLVLLAPDPQIDMAAIAGELAQVVTTTHKPVISCFMGDATMRPVRHLLDNAGTPAFRTPESAANAFGVLASYHYNQTLSQQMLPPRPLGKPPRLKEARLIIRAARMGARESLLPDEVARLFACFHIPISLIIGDGDAGLRGADEDIAMSIRVHRDPALGPYINFGSGGRQGISASDRAVELPPLNGYLASQLVQRSALWRTVLSRQMSTAASDCLQESLERVSDLVCELPGVHDLVIDPLYAGDGQLLARTVHLRLSSEDESLVPPEASGYGHLVIHPYPHNLVQNKVFADGTAWMMRPIRPEDAEALQEFVRGLSNESRYMRFVSMLRELTPRMLARYTRIDYDRELALVATVQVANPQHRGYMREQIIGFAHYLRNPDGRGAEYALVIGDNRQRRGLGTELMRGVISTAKTQALTYIEGVVLATNTAMLDLMARMGFANEEARDDLTMRRVWLDLGETRLGNE